MPVQLTLPPSSSVVVEENVPVADVPSAEGTITVVVLVSVMSLQSQEIVTAHVALSVVVVHATIERRAIDPVAITNQHREGEKEVEWGAVVQAAERR